MRKLVGAVHVLLVTLSLALPLLGQAPEAKTLQHDLVEISRLARSFIAQVEDVGTDGQVSRASAVFLNEEGYVVTCLHAVKDLPNGKITVKVGYESYNDISRENFFNGNWTISSASIVATDEVNDIVILKVESNVFSENHRHGVVIQGHSLSYQVAAPRWENAIPRSGQIAILAGYPLGEPFGIVQQGYVAAFAGTLPPWFPPHAPKILVSIVANPGNSGGPVLNEDGDVIGLLEGELPSPAGRSGLAIIIPAHYIISLASKNHLTPGK